ncbi:unnamed protein product [Paramecium octaurelia]|uniref:Uncharacterized protein n=1 Tax=Paramecium octaurelia TaxID=43137 RepID=A0A8S1VUQ4_PAROT|nr:unnamed protein product [Paramecium octaurelia]
MMNLCCSDPVSTRHSTGRGELVKLLKMNQRIKKINTKQRQHK